MVQNHETVKKIPTTNFLRSDGGQIQLQETTKKISYTYDKGMLLNSTEFISCS